MKEVYIEKHPRNIFSGSVSLFDYNFDFDFYDTRLSEYVIKDLKTDMPLVDKIPTLDNCYHIIRVEEWFLITY